MTTRTMTAWCFLFLSASTVACVEVEKVRGPDGQPDWLAITCHGRQSLCQREASEQCPKGYITAESGGHTSFVSTTSKYVTTTSSSYQGETLIRCQAGGVQAIALADQQAEIARQEAAQQDAALAEIQKHPKFPELGAPKPEAKATCVHERGEWLDQGERVGCKVKGELVFVCTVGGDATMSGCTHYKLGADMTDERDTIVQTRGKPTSTGTGDRGFRVYTWETPDRGIVLTGYAAGVIVTETKVSGGVTAP